MAADRLDIGFVPLCDAAPLVIAKEEGLFEEYGLDVTLRRGRSWAHVRDQLAFGDLDAAHMLAPMVVASALGLTPTRVSFATALGLNLNGNGITVSNALYKEMQDVDPWAFDARPVTAASLKEIAKRRQDRGQTPVTFAMVYPFSTHNYLLRYWLAASGLHPDKDVRLIVVPPPDMVQLCESESIDGYCVGEPWNTLAVHRGIGHQIVGGSEIWPAAPEKVMGVRRNWLDDHEEVYLRLIRSLMKAAQVLESAEVQDRAATYLAREDYIGIDVRHLQRALGSSAHKQLRATFDASVAGFPWHSKAAWLASQMVRWGQASWTTEFEQSLASSFRTDLFRAAAAEEGIRYPLVDRVVEGAHDESWPLDEASASVAMPGDRFMDRRSFDMTDREAYVDGFDIANQRAQNRPAGD